MLPRRDFARCPISAKSRPHRSRWNTPSKALHASPFQSRFRLFTKSGTCFFLRSHGVHEPHHAEFSRHALDPMGQAHPPIRYDGVLNRANPHVPQIPNPTRGKSERDLFPSLPPVRTKPDSRPFHKQEGDRNKETAANLAHHASPRHRGYCSHGVPRFPYVSLLIVTDPLFGLLHRLDSFSRFRDP